MAKRAEPQRKPAGRMVIVVQQAKRARIYASRVVKSPYGFRYFVFERDRAKALKLTEREALTVLDEWTAADRPSRNLCVIEPAS